MGQKIGIFGKHDFPKIELSKCSSMQPNPNQLILTI